MSLVLTVTLALSASSGDWRNIDSVPGFPGWRPFIERYVRSYATKRVNAVCIVTGLEPTAASASGRVAYLYWPAEKRIDRLSPTQSDKLEDDLIGYKSIHLDSDVIGEHGQRGFSPTSVTHRWVERLLTECRTVGTRFTVIKGS